MTEGVSDLLERRGRRRTWISRIGSFLAALTLHVALVASALVAPALFAEKPETFEYVPVELILPPALGTEEAPPTVEEEPTQPDPEPEPEPEPESVPEEPPVPEPEAAPPDPGPEEDRSEPVTPPGEPERRPAERPGSPVGDPDAPVSRTASVATVDDPDFTSGYYLERMLAAVRSFWTRPPVGTGIEAVVHFRIRSDGSLENVRISQSSGHQAFDLAALRAVQSAAPLPPLPRSYRQDSLGVNLIFR